MNKAEEAGREIRAVEELATGTSFMHSLSPLAKLITTIVYILTVVSFNKYDFSGLIIMALMPVVTYQLAEVPLSLCFRKTKLMLVLVCAVGIFNPFFDRAVVTHIGGLAVTGGMISMLTLMMKGLFTLLQSFLLVATTPIDEICRALRSLHVPKLLVSLILLTYRYVGLLVDEAAIMTTAYQLRAPGQKGIHHSAWGSFLGQLILRSMDRAHDIYDSMRLRGFTGDFAYSQAKPSGRSSWLYMLIACLLIIAARLYNVVVVLGSLVTGVVG